MIDSYSDFFHCEYRHASYFSKYVSYLYLCIPQQYIFKKCLGKQTNKMFGLTHKSCSMGSLGPWVQASMKASPVIMLAHRGRVSRPGEASVCWRGSLLPPCGGQNQFIYSCFYTKKVQISVETQVDVQNITNRCRMIAMVVMKMFLVFPIFKLCKLLSFFQAKYRL